MRLRVNLSIALELSFEVLEDLGDVAHDALPVRSLNLAHLVDILKAKRSQSSEFAVRKVESYQSRVDSNSFRC